MDNLVPEVYCSDFSVTKMFYIKVFGFTIQDENEEQTVARFNFGKLVFILEKPLPTDAHKNAIKLKKSFSSNIDFSCAVEDVTDLYFRVKALSPNALCSKIEEKKFQQDGTEILHKQFIAKDPDGYFFRFYQ